MQITVITIFVIGIILLGFGYAADHLMAKRGEPPDVRSIAWWPILIGVVTLVLDAVLIVGWSVWHLFGV